MPAMKCCFCSWSFNNVANEIPHTKTCTYTHTHTHTHTHTQDNTYPANTVVASDPGPNLPPKSFLLNPGVIVPILKGS